MATLRERLDADLKDGMRARDELKTTVIRMIKSAVKYKEVEATAKTLDDAGIIAVMTTMVKQRRDSIEEFNKAGRGDLAEKEQREIAIIQGFMPPQLSADDVARAVAQAISEAAAKSMKDLGAVMKVITPRLKGQAEGKAISDEVKLQLSRLG
jgi:uncharacterized protein YqeY